MRLGTTGCADGLLREGVILSDRRGGDGTVAAEGASPGWKI
jgi:hypothetical protein